MKNIVTIVAKNYLAQARVLVDSFKKHHPDGKAFVLFVDKIDGYFDPEKENFIALELEVLRDQIPNLEGFCFQYSVLELCTAVKPFVIHHLFQHYALDQLAYFDPDIMITASLQPLADLLNHHDMVLTPHLTKPYYDQENPSEVDILKAGTYNLGFIALSNTEDALSMLVWWKEKLYRQCLVDMTNGLFVDQKWIDLILGFFPKVYVLRDPGYNVAYWNLHERAITLKNDQFFCNGTLLRFFHYSGYDPTQPDRVSKHQDRHSMDSIKKTRELFKQYSNLLMSSGYLDCKAWPYTYATFDNQIMIPGIARRVYLNAQQEQFANPFITTHDNSFYQWLTSFEKDQVPPLLAEIYRARLDLQMAFPQLNAEDKVGFIHWCLTAGVSQYQLDRRLLHAVISHPVYVTASTPLMGVNLMGYMNSEKGVGTAVRSHIKCLNRTRFPVALNNIVDTYSRNQESTEGMAFSTTSPYRVNLVQINADQVIPYAKTRPDTFFKDRYTIGSWEWELSDFPEAWYEAFQYLDEVWVPSSFTQEAIACISPIPVVKIPHAIDVVEVTEPSQDRQSFGIPAENYIFLFMFDFESFCARKNPEGLIAAFREAFQTESNVTLVIKTAHSKRHLADLKQLQILSQGSNIILLDEVMSKDQIHSLLYHADCYVSLHRCEGYGLTIAEAMSFGKPVIATGYSGNMDFMTAENSYPVGYELVEIDRDYGPYRKGWVWAEPDLKQAARLMRYVYEHPEEAVVKGLAAKAHIIKYFSPDVIQAAYQKRLDHISKKIQNYEKINVIETLELKQKIDNMANDCFKIASSRRSVAGFLIRLYKRIVRKSVFWMLAPLVTRLREIHFILARLIEQKNVGEKAALNQKTWEGEKVLLQEINQIKQHQKNMTSALKQVKSYLEEEVR